MMNDLRLFFLGPISFQRQSHLVDFRIGKMQALLAYLAITRQPQTREHLIDLLWTESPPDAARKNLRNGLWRLRQQFGVELLVAEGEHLRLASVVWTDVAAFESGLTLRPETGGVDGGEHRTTLDLWRGPLLDDIKLTDASDFELWLSGERVRLSRLYLGGLQSLLVSLQAAAQWDNVIDVAQRALAADESQEPMHVAMMEALAQLDRRSEALRQYDTLRTLLARELSAQPLPETEALRKQILSGSYPMKSKLPFKAVGETPVLRQPIVRPLHPFVGRVTERKALNEAMQAAANDLQIVLLSGELGIGKSTLWQHWSATHDSTATILEARCLASTQALPLAPLMDLFGTQIGLQTIAASESPLSPVWLTELSRVLPQIGDIRPDLPPAAVLPPDEERRRLYEAFIQVLRVLPSPRILFVDDLHWADQATLDWLAYLTERMRREALLLVGTFRDGEAAPSLSQAIGRWSRELPMRRLPLAPFSRQEASSLIDELDGNVAMVDYLHRQSGGNPYYLTELSQVHPDGMPAALVDLIGARLRSLPEDATRLLQTAAILEPIGNFELLQEANQWSEERTLDALDVLLARGTLVEQETAYAFAHPLVAGIVRDSMSTPRRQFLHRRSAELLQAHYVDATATSAGQLAFHYAKAGQPEEAARFADQAANRAVQIGAMIEAANFHRQALILDPTPSRRSALGYALMHVPGGLTEAREVMQQALVDAENEYDQKAMVQIGLRLAFSYLSTEQGEQVLQWADRIRAAADDSQDMELRATIEYLMAAGKFNTRHLMAEAEQHYRAATDLVSAYDLDTEIAVQSWFGWGNLAVQQGNYAQAQRNFQRTLALARSSNNIYFEALCYNNLGYSKLLIGDLEEARKTVESGLAFIATNQLLRPRQYLYSTRGEVALAEDDLDAAEAWFRRAIDEANIYDNETHAANIRAHLGRVTRARGDLDGAIEQLESVFQFVADGGAAHLQIQIELWLAELYVEVGNIEMAEDSLERARQSLTGNQRQALIDQEKTLSAKLKDSRLSRV